MKDHGTHSLIERRSDRFKDLVASGALIGQPVRKDVSPGSVKAVKGRDRCLEFVITTGSKDRDGDIVESSGAVIENYLKNPVVLWAHQSRELPVARALEVRVQKSQIVTVEEFTPPDLNPFGYMVFRMYEGGYLHASSIGFRPLEMEPMEDDGQSFFLPMRFTRWELLENSKVPIPANPDALMRAHADGIDTAPLREWCERMLDGDRHLKGLTTSDVEGAWKAISERGFVLEVASAGEEGDDAETEAANAPLPAPEPTPSPDGATESPPAPTEEPAPDSGPREASYVRVDGLDSCDSAWVEVRGIETPACGSVLDLGAIGSVVVRSVAPGDPPRLHVEPWSPGDCPGCGELALDDGAVRDGEQRMWHQRCADRTLAAHGMDPEPEHFIEIEVRDGGPSSDDIEIEGIDSEDELSDLMSRAIQGALAR